MEHERPFYTFSDCHSEQLGDQHNLLSHVTFAHPSQLPLSYHVHDIKTLSGSPCGLEGEETHARPGQALDTTMVLFDQVVEICDLPQFDCFWKDPGSVQIGDGFGVGSILVHIDHTPSSRSGGLGNGLLDHISLRCSSSRDV